LCFGSASDHRQLALRIECHLVRCRPYQDGREHLLSEHLSCEIQVLDIYESPWAQQNSIEGPTIAIGNCRVNRSGEFSLGHGFHLKHIDCLPSWRDSTRWFAFELGLVHLAGEQR
jgi:hypothetical protein